MRKLITGFLIIVLVVFLARCKKDKTNWSPEYAFPLAEGELSFLDFQNDDILILDEDVVKIHYYDTLSPLNLSEIINLGDTILEAVYTPGFSFGPIPFDNGATIFTLEEEFEFNIDDAELRTGKIKTGSLKIIFESDADGYLDLGYTLSGMTLAGEPLFILGQTNPATTANPFTDEIIVDVSGYELDLTGASGLERNTLTGALSVSTSAGPTYTAQILGNAEVKVKMELISLEVEELRGYFGQISKSIEDTIVLDDVFYQGGLVSLSEIDASFEFINNFGIDAQVQLEELVMLNTTTNSEVILETPGLTDLMSFSRAIESSYGVTPSSQTLDFGVSSNLSEAVSITPNSIILKGDAILNPLGDVTGGFDFYLSEYPFQIVTDLNLPLCIGLDNFTLADTLDIDLDNIDDISKLILNINLKNEFPLGLNFSVHFLGDDSALGEGFIQSAPEGESVESKIQLTLDAGQILKLEEVDQLVVSVSANTYNSEEAKILTTDKIDILITAQITYEAEY